MTRIIHPKQYRTRPESKFAGGGEGQARHSEEGIQQRINVRWAEYDRQRGLIWIDGKPVWRPPNA